MITRIHLFFILIVTLAFPATSLAGAGPLLPPGVGNIETKNSIRQWIALLSANDAEGFIKDAFNIKNLEKKGHAEKGKIKDSFTGNFNRGEIKKTLAVLRQTLNMKPLLNAAKDEASYTFNKKTSSIIVTPGGSLYMKKIKGKWFIILK